MNHTSYKHKLLEQGTSPDGYPTALVGVYQLKEIPHASDPGSELVKIGEYLRDYTDSGPFHAFTQNGRDYALYSPRYTCTRVMSLPDCKDIAGETDETGSGYCPLDFYVPRTPEDHHEFRWQGVPYEDRVNGQFGVVSGCYWGAEMYNPIYYLDLSRINDGILTRDDRFGNLEQPPQVPLKDCIGVRWYTKDNPLVDVVANITCDTRVSFDLDTEMMARELVHDLHGSMSEEEETTLVEKLLSKLLWRMHS